MQRHSEHFNLVRLSKREGEVLQLLCAGVHGTKAIAERLGISESTTAGHVDAMLGELQFQGRFSLTIWGWQHPEAARGEWVDASVHKPGCHCRFCSMLRLDRAA